MERFNMNFQNKRVRVWFAFVLPLILLAVLLYISLPKEFEFIPTLIIIVGFVIYQAWVVLDKRKQRSNK
ncbi:hypothetical protein AUO94_08930 [Planococcus kocurii]|uniref:Permease n=1 Tax=Planococcus kocurii TaxID=1374 RepID=A0ABM5WWP7_9BACL|nr:hypothetical protein [Planococcus kocurii]ALS78771.1 hypothetical protein AUO94_08930 [Planococcus kocurii]